MSNKKGRFPKSPKEVLKMTKDVLQRQGERMIELAAKINPSGEGRRLNADELELVRVSYLPEVKHCASQSVANYVSNNKSYFEADLEHMETIFSDLEKM